MTYTLKQLQAMTDKLILDYCKGKNKNGKYDWSYGWAYFGKEIARLLEIAIFQDDDIVLVFDGSEGAGKSLFMRKIGALIHRLLILWDKPSEFSLDNITFRIEEYINLSIKKGKEGRLGYINILDESRRELNRSASQSRSNRNFTDYLSECRDTNQIHMISLPSFHDLDKNLVLFRQRYIVHVKKKMVSDKNTLSGSSLKRGDFVCYIRGRELINSYFSKVRYTYPKKYIIKGKFDGEEPEEMNIGKYIIKKAEFREKKYKTQREKDIGKKEANKEFNKIVLPKFT